MPIVSIQPTYPVFTGLDGLPLDAGYIWFGVANLDPQTNPTVVYWDSDQTIVAPQPIRTLNGYPVRSGTPARIYIANDYSIRVQDKNGSTLYNAAYVGIEDTNTAPFVIQNDTGQEITISMVGNEFAFSHTQAGEFLTFNGTGDLYFPGVAATAQGADFAQEAATVSDNGVRTAMILDLNVTTSKINNLAVTSTKLADASVSEVKLVAASVTASKLNGAQSGSAPIYGARAWAYFAGDTIVTLRAGGNVTSITDLGVGDYQVNFSVAMQDTQFSVSGSASSDQILGADSGRLFSEFGLTSRTTSACRVCTAYVFQGTDSTVPADSANVSVAIHR
jgi:hypothetical protein